MITLSDRSQTMTIGDSRLCRLRFYGIVAAEYNHVPLDGGDTLSPGSPPVSTVEEVQGIAYNSVN